jgi:hypothetical protein
VKLRLELSYTLVLSCVSCQWFCNLRLPPPVTSHPPCSGRVRVIRIIPTLLIAGKVAETNERVSIVSSDWLHHAETTRAIAVSSKRP